MFRMFLSLTDPLVATFNEMGATTFKKYAAEKRIVSSV